MWAWQSGIDVESGVSVTDRIRPRAVAALAAVGLALSITTVAVRDRGPAQSVSVEDGREGSSPAAPGEVTLAAPPIGGVQTEVVGGVVDPAPPPSATTNPAASPTPSPTPSPTSSAGPSVPSTTPPAVASSAGRLDLSRSPFSAGSGRPVLAVKISNTSRDRPQQGLLDADVVFEELTEAGITRFIALYQAKIPTTVGPIRSGRIVDADVLPAYGRHIAISGARPDVLELFDQRGFLTISEDTGVMFRSSARRAPYNLYARGPKLFNVARDSVAASTGWVHDDAVPLSECDPGAARGLPCRPVEALSVRMSRGAVTGWRWDAAAGGFRRYQNGQRHTDASGTHIGAANVVVLGVEISEGGCCDSVGNRLTVTNIIGSGTAIVLRDARRHDVRWAKASRTAPIRLTDDLGRDVPLRDGPTWVMMAPRENLPS